MSPLLLLASFAATLLAEGFTEVCDEHGVKVWRRDAARGFELAAEGEIAAPPDEVLRVLADYEEHPRWVAHLAESRVLHRSNDALDVYQRLALPILADRDYTLHVAWGSDGAARWLRFAAANELGPAPSKGVERVEIHEGTWRLEPIDGGRATRASYRVHLDLAGSLPGWMSRGRAAKDVPGFFERLRARVARR